MNWWVRIVVLTASLATLSCHTGCGPLTVASAGAIAGLTATAFTTGADAYRMGKLDSVDNVRYDVWIDSVKSAAGELHLKLEKPKDNGKGIWTCVVKDDRGDGADIRVDRRTEMLCETRIDVGWFGSEPAARLILSRIRYYAEKKEPRAATRAATTTQAAG
jgi:hypothetical protein